MTDSSLAGQIVLITGGGRGIGAATALMAAARGAKVAINYRSNSEAAESVVAACLGEGSDAIALAGDVSSEADVVAMFEATAAQLGTPTVLVNNAGIIREQARLDEFTAERLHDVMSVNVIGAMLCAREAVRCMSTRHGGAGGSIISVSSAAAYNGSPNEFIDYAASKGAIDSMTIGLAKEVAREGLRVNAVRPGLIDTQIHASIGLPDRVEQLKENIPVGRGGTTDEVAEAILWLASEQSSYVTGALLNVSGGR